MSLAWKLHHRERIIKKRKAIVLNIWQSPIYHPLLVNPSKMSKFNLNCGCAMCHFYKYAGNKLSLKSGKEQQLLKEFKLERNEYARQ